MSKEKRIEVLSLFKQMAECDGYIDPREIDVINSING